MHQPTSPLAPRAGHRQIIIATLLAALLGGCGGEDTTTGPGKIKDLAKDATSDALGVESDTASGAPDAPDTAPGVDVAASGCTEDWQCSGLSVPLCNAPKCLDGKCGPLPTAEGVACDDANACTTSDMCQGGLCSGLPKSCDDNDPCTDDACAANTGACSHTPLPEGASATCDDGDKCTGADKCQGGKCVGEATSCDDGNPCTDDGCDADGACQHTPNQAVCGPSGKCQSPGKCEAGKCVAGGPLTCDDKNPCTNDSCKEETGLCVYTPLVGGDCDDGDKCTSGEQCQGGKCQGGAAKTCTGGVVCSPVKCSPATGLCALAPETGTACDDGDKCTTADSCLAGACQGGPALACGDDNPCTTDSCDPKSGCAHANNTAACSDNLQCVIGACKEGKCVPGATQGCDDNNPCTSDTCTKAKGCLFEPINDGGACGDKDACQEASVCKAGKCVAGAKSDCDDGNPCTDDLCAPKSGCMWEANEAACDDGNACTQGDQCNNGQCKPGVKVDPAKACDDNNPCTTDGCDPKSGCSHAVVEGACDDGDICTAVESCVEGKCVPSKAKCEDTGPCMAAACAPVTGLCSWTSKVGACDDGDACTAGDHCDKGKCVPTGPATCDDKNPCTVDACKEGKCQYEASSGEIKCDDGDLCTPSDMCQGGQCKGSGAPVCDDGNACTIDGCNPASGKCTFKPSTGPCDNGDLCTFGDKCNNGKCVTGASQVCNDGNACTTDSCDPKTGKCAHKAAADGAACDDGKACSTGDKCQAGKCQPTNSAKCALWLDTFECAAKGAGWTLDKPSGLKVIWAVDQSPTVGGEGTWGCNLNFNNGTNYCDKAGNGCQKPIGNALSPSIDGTALAGPGIVSLRTYMDLDSGYSDRPYLAAFNEKNQQIWYTFIEKNGNEKKWVELKYEVAALKGQKFRLRLNLYNPSGSGNQGKGWFVDNLRVDAKPIPEVCNDGLDNDGNGLKDCFDPACAGQPGCVEDCADGLDNDKDDKVDCKDSDCSGAPECQPLVFQQDFQCGVGGWLFEDLKRNGVAFAIDATPATPTPLIGGCTLNFNNGKNYCGVKDCAKSDTSNATAGTATWASQIDAVGYKKLWAVYWSWIDGEPEEGNKIYYDRAWLQASVDGYNGCCGATYSCPGGASNTCNTATSGTWGAPRKAEDQKKWRKVTVDLSKFAGKKFSLRFRFNSGDGQFNQTSGWFVDKLRIYGSN